MDKGRQMGKDKNGVIFPVAPNLSEMGDGYLEFIDKIKNQIQNQRNSLVLKANASMICLYWNIGNAILQKQQEEGWGTKVIDRISIVHKGGSKMKKLNIFLVVVLMLTLVQTPIMSVAKSSSSSVKKGVSTKVLSVSKKKIEFKITNNTDTYITYGEQFVLKKYTKGKWVKVPFKEGIAFKEIAYMLESGGTAKEKIVWKHCVDKNLSKGKYKIIFTNSKVKATFKIK